MIPHTNNSFSYKTIHPIIRKVLDNRSILDNTTQMSMPFVKATSTLRLPSILGEGNIGFTLGIHLEHDIKYQDIYASQEGNYLVGYTYQPDGKNKLIYADTPSVSENLLEVFDLRDRIVDTTEFSFAPPPGITRVTIGKRRSGLINVGQINFSVPTLIQLEFLHKTFLVPGIGIILEWGQQFISKQDKDLQFGEYGLIGEDFSQYMFPWYDAESRDELFARLARNDIGTQEIVEKYSYPTQGQYQWMFGRVASFNITSNPDGSYECSVRIAGPAEDSWAYSVRNTAVPAVSKGPDARVCINNTNSVEKYFTKKGGLDSFIGVLEATYNCQDDDDVDETKCKDELRQWKDFVERINPSSENSSIINRFTNMFKRDEATLELEDAYFISWRYFVNVILNDEKFGVKSIFKNANDDNDWLTKISLLRKYNNVNGSEVDFIGFKDPYENPVGLNKYLRSTDLSTMFIVNEQAAKLAINDQTRRIGSEAESQFLDQRDIARYKNKGSFFESAYWPEEGEDRSLEENVRIIRDSPDFGFLSTGVWINHKAIIQSFSTATTVLNGIQNLLNRMSSATSGYWNLVVDVSEPVPRDDDEFHGTTESDETISIYNYSVVDLNYAENSEEAVKKFLNPNSEYRVHVFNKYIRRRFNERDGLEPFVGSELTNCKVDISLPKAMFSQIATLGLVQPNDQYDEDEAGDANSALSNMHDEMRKMFSITSLARDAEGKSADLTALTVSRPVSRCGESDASSEAGILAATISDPLIAQINEISSEKDLNDIEASNRSQLNSLNDFITQCRQKCTTEVEPTSAEEVAQADEEPRNYRFRLLTELTVGQVKTAGLESNRHIFAAGRYQIVPRTLGWATSDPRIRIYDDDLFNESTQDKLLNWLVFTARPALGNYLLGSGTLFEAHLDLAKEWAGISIPCCRPVLLSDNETRVDISPTDSKSYYDGDGINSAHVTAEEASRVLRETRLDFDNGFRSLDRLANLISSAESRRNGYNALNIKPRPAAGTPVYAPNPNEDDYLRAINGFPHKTVDPSYNTSDPVPTNPNISSTNSDTSGEFVQCVQDDLRAQLDQLQTRRRSLAVRRAEVEGQINALIRQPERARQLALQLQIIIETTDSLTLEIEQLLDANQQVLSDGITAEACNRAIRGRDAILLILNQIEIRKSELPRIAALDAIIRNFSNLRSLFIFLEPLPDYMIANIRKTGDGVRSNAFGAAPGSLSIKADLELPGINGLRLGELFWIDRIPAFYRAYGAFIILGVEDTITLNGWTTKFDGTFYYLGNAWKLQMAKILSGELSLDSE